MPSSNYWMTQLPRWWRAKTGFLGDFAGSGEFVESRVGAGWNCSIPQNVPNVVIRENPSHGTLVVKDLPSGAPCNNGPLKGVFYTSQPGYGYLPFAPSGSQLLFRQAL